MSLLYFHQDYESYGSHWIALLQPQMCDCVTEKLIWCIALKAMGSCQRYIRFVLVLQRTPHPCYTPNKYTKAMGSQWMALLQPPHQHVCVREDQSWYFQQHPHVVICMTMESFKLCKRFDSDPGNNIKDVILFHQTYEIHGHGSPWMAYLSLNSASMAEQRGYTELIFTATTSSSE